MSLKVGEVTKNTGISVRTLHYHEEIGFLPPVPSNGRWRTGFHRGTAPQKADELRSRHQKVEASFWNSMVEDLLDEIRRGTSPTGRRALALTKRWRGSVKLLMGDDLIGDADLLAMFRADPQSAHGHGLDKKSVV